MNRIFNSKGFTLVELLVVIGVLGILAAGLLATIDPLEQFRKGADSNRKTTSLELVNALTRYYAAHNVFPWAATSAGGDACNIETAPSGVAADNANFATCLTALISQGELKSTFNQQTNLLKTLLVTDLTSGSDARVAVCFNPESKSESARAETKYSATGGVPATGVSCPTNTASCYWCAQ